MSLQASILSTSTPNPSSVVLRVENNPNVNEQIQTCSHNKKIGIGGASGALFGGALPALLLHGQNLEYITAPFQSLWKKIFIC